MIVLENESDFKNPFTYNIYWVVNFDNVSTKTDFYCLARSKEEIIDMFPESQLSNIVDNTEYVLTNGPSLESIKRLLKEERFGKIICSVGNGLHQRKWRWMDE